MSENWKDPIHPSEILAGELDEIGINAVELAVRIGVPDNRIYQIINGKRDITADTALRLGQFFGTGADLWMNLQKAYELDVAKGKIGNSLKTIIPVERQTGNGADHTPTKP